MKKTQTKVSVIKTPHTTPKIIGKSLKKKKKQQQYIRTFFLENAGIINQNYPLN